MAFLVVVCGVVCSAAINSTAGGTLGAALAAIGCVALLRMVVTDLGWTEKAHAEQQAARMERLSGDPSPDSPPSREGRKEAE